MNARTPTWNRRESGQILPLVFFLGIAFFTSVILAVNTGRTTVRRIKAQNAVDAAAASGVNSVARGMNYLASNNIQISKSLALVLIMRSFPEAYRISRLTLDGWELAAQAMRAAASSPWTAFLQAVAAVIDVKVRIEREIIDAAEEVTDVLADDVLQVDDEDNGLIWRVIHALDDVGTAIAYATPVIAQVNARSVFARNIEPESGDAWMLPVYPNMPVCEGTFPDFYDKTKEFADDAAVPIYIAGAAALTLSLFPLWYKLSLISELNQMFTGQAIAIDESDSTLDDLNEIQESINGINAQMVPVREARAQILDELIALGADLGLDMGEAQTDAAGIKTDMAAQMDIAADLNSTPEQAEAAGNAVTDLEDDREQLYADVLGEVRTRIDELEGGSSAQQDQADAASTDVDKPISGIDPRWQTQLQVLQGLQQDLEDLDVGGTVDERLGDAPMEPPGPGLGELQGEMQDRDSPHPWLLDPAGYPASFSYLTLSWRDIAAPITSVHFQRQMQTGYTYAAARVYNPTAADLWTPDWRARLVRVTADMIARNPIGTLPGSCGEDRQEAGMSDLELGDGEAAPDAGGMQDTLTQFFSFLSKH